MLLVMFRQTLLASALRCVRPRARLKFHQWFFFKRGMSESRVTYKPVTQPDCAREPSGFFMPLKGGAECRIT